MKKNFKIKAKVWKWPGLSAQAVDAPWHFVNIDKKVSEEIRSVYKKGFVYVTAKIGKTSWDTALFPHKQSGAYLLSIKAIVRKKEGILEGDILNISFNIK
jgi:hypothetical protein